MSALEPDHPRRRPSAIPGGARCRDRKRLSAARGLARAALPALVRTGSKEASIDDEVAQQMSHGYYVNVPTRSEYHPGALYTEARLGSLIAARQHFAIEQAMVRITLANHLEDDVIQDRFGADPITPPVLGLLGDEDFLD